MAARDLSATSPWCQRRYMVNTLLIHYLFHFYCITLKIYTGQRSGSLITSSIVFYIIFLKTQQHAFCSFSGSLFRCTALWIIVSTLDILYSLLYVTTKCHKPEIVHQQWVQGYKETIFVWPLSSGLFLTLSKVMERSWYDIWHLVTGRSLRF